MLVKEVEACSFDKWFSSFKKVTFKSIILPIPPDVLAYLRSDGSLILPKECNDKRIAPDNDDSDNESVEEWSDEDDENDVTEQPSFPEFHRLLTEAISDLGGNVFPKLNWSAPKDATWMGFANCLRCTTPSQVWLLLKSSDFISHDLTQPYKDTDDVLALGEEFSEPNYFLVLRTWVDINPGFEFRCFVRAGSIVAITQRDQTQFYNHIGQERSTILRDIVTFHSEHLKSKFALLDYVFDVVRFRKDKVKLVDFNPFGKTTDPILFDWSDIEELDPSISEIEFRFVEDDAGIQPSTTRHYSLPQDIVDIAGGTDHEKMVDFLKMQSNIQEKEEGK